MNELRHKLIHGVAWTVTQQGGQQVLSLLTLLWLAKLLGPDAFGLLALATTFNAMISVCFGEGIRESLVQRKECEPSHFSSAFWFNLLLASVLVGVAALSAPIVESVFDAEGLTDIIRVLSLRMLAIAFLAVPLATLQRDMAYKKIAIRGLAGTAAGAVTAIVMALNGFGVWSLVGKELVQSVVRAIGLWTAASWRPHRTFSTSRLRELLRFEISLTGNNVVIFLKNRLAMLLIGLAFPARVLGYYGLANTVMVGLGNILTVTMSSVAFAGFTKLQDDNERLAGLYLAVTRLSATVAMPVFFGLAITGSLAAEVVLTDKWNPVAPVLSVLCILGAVRSVQFFQGTLLRAIGQPQLTLRNNARHGVLCLLVLTAAIVTKAGVRDFAILQVVCALAMQPLWIASVNRSIGVSFGQLLNQLRTPITSTAVMASAVWLADFAAEDHFSPALRLPASIALGVVVYTVATLAISPQFVSDIRGLAQQLLATKKPK